MDKHQKRLATDNISRLLLSQSLPATIGLLVVSLYNVVDTIFIGYGVGTLGIAGLAIAFPVQMVTMSIANLLGIGSSSIISRALGAKNSPKAERALGHFVTLSVIFGVVLTAVGVVFLDQIMSLFGATDTILPYATEYMSVVFWGTIFVFFVMGGSNIIRSEGNAKFTMGLMLASTLVNIALDPLFIFTFDMGIKGAAIATVIAQGVAAVCVLAYFFFSKSGVVMHLRNLKLKLKMVKEIFAIGSSSFARHVAASAMAIVINNSLGFYGGDTAIAAYGILNRIFMVVMLPLFGLIQGFMPIVGYSYGARAMERAKAVTKLSIKVSTVMSSVAFVLLLFFAEYLAGVFTPDQELIDLSAYATRILVIMMPFIGFQVVAGGYYQAIGKALPAFFLSILRQVVLLLPLVLIFPLFYGLNGVFYAFPVADFVAVVITGFMMWFEVRRMTR